MSRPLVARGEIATFCEHAPNDSVCLWLRTASRGRCADGSHAFMGSKGPCLVVTPDRQIAIGTALGGPNNLIDTSRPSFSRDSSGKPVITFPAPNLDAAGKKF